MLDSFSAWPAPVNEDAPWGSTAQGREIEEQVYGRNAGGCSRSKFPPGHDERSARNHSRSQ